MNLSDEQVEAAAKAMYKADASFHNLLGAWETLDKRTRHIYANTALAAAPFLQMPWNAPTDKEVRAIAEASNYYPALGLIGQVSNSLHTFLRIRNASLIPKPVDPRREKIMTALKTGVMNPVITDDCAEFIADRILAALDADKEGA